MKADVSLCIIVKNEPLLENCLESIKDYVSEIVIVDTGSTDDTPEVAKKYATIFETYTNCNNPETGLIEDFSKARNRSFELATKPWIMWCDADDIIDGGEHLYALTQDFELNENRKNLDTMAYLFPYEYSHDANGNCTCRHYRERLFYGKDSFNFVNPVHEVAIPKENMRSIFVKRDDIIFIHKRQVGKEAGRNIRILRKYFEENGGEDPRQMYYLALECSSAGQIDEAIQLFTKYINVSGWDEERVMACLKLVDIYQGQGNYEEGLKWSLKAISIYEMWGEGYFAAARMYYFLAAKNDRNSYRNWERCIHFANEGLSKPPTQTVLFINPLEREFDIYRYLNVAYNAVGNVEAALIAANTALQKHDDALLLKNKKLYEEHLSRLQIMGNVDILKRLGTVDQIAVDAITSIIHNKPIGQFPPYNKSTTYPKDISAEQFPLAITTPHSQAWGIPNTLEIDDLPLRMTDEQLQSVTIMMWRQYLLHDELLAAESFLKNAPYNIRDTKTTQDALKITQKMIGWLKDPELMQKHNAPTDPNSEIDIPMPYPLIDNQSGGRYKWVVNHLPTSKVSIVDFGCVDGCFTNRYAMLGHDVYGLDVVETSVALANKKAEEFKTGAKHIVTYFQDAVDKVPNNYFDYATSTDTYEHLIDPVNDMLIPAQKMLKSNGKFLLCTPYGAWFRGNYVEWGHPWIWSREGVSWLCTRPRGHLMAPSSWSVANHFKEAGYYVYNSYAAPSLIQNVQDQGNIFTEAYVQSPTNYPGLDIVFFIGQGVEAWTPETVKKNGIGGSELMAIEMSKRLAKQGNRVRVYNSCGKHGEGIYEGVEYYHTEKYEDLDCDVLIVSRNAEYLNEKYKIRAKLTLLWVHDVYAINATNITLLRADKILALTEWHKQNIINVHNVHKDQVLVTRNGIDLSRFDKTVTRNNHRAINSSSPDRSWPVLLDCWPEIRKQVPDAELHLFYGFKNWEYSAQFQPGQSELIERIKQQIKLLEADGVVYHDRVSQDQLSEEFLKSGCWIHPTWFSETSCITAMEAQASGLRIVTSSIAALNETVGDRGTLIDGNWASPEYKKQFISAVVEAMNKEDQSDRDILKTYAEDNFSLDTLTKDWNKMFYDLMEAKKVSPLNLYSPTKNYKG